MEARDKGWELGVTRYGLDVRRYSLWVRRQTLFVMGYSLWVRRYSLWVIRYWDWGSADLGRMIGGRMITCTNETESGAGQSVGM